MTDEDREASAKAEKQAKIDELLSKLSPVNSELPEAGGTAWIVLYSQTGGEYHLTERGDRAWFALQDLAHTVQLAGLVLGMRTTRPEPPAATPPAVPADQRIAAEAGNAPLAAELKANVEALPKPPDGKVWETFEARRFLVVPQPDSKVTIEFYGDGRKYPDVKVNKWTIDRAAALMKHVTAEAMDKPGDYTLPCRVFYTEGKEFIKADNTKGHYKDIGHVRPL